MSAATDADGDVLYLTRGESNMAAEAVLMPEGHGVRYGLDGEVIGVTIIKARWLLVYAQHPVLLIDNNPSIGIHGGRL